MRPEDVAEDEIVRSLSQQQRDAQDKALMDGQDPPPALLFEDAAFSPAQLSTLYTDSTKLPEYAASTSSSASRHADEGKDSDDNNDEDLESRSVTPNGVGGVFWYRPTEFTDDPDYFKSTAGCGVLREGVLRDAWLLGVFAAIAVHADNLIENLFVSESLHAFKQYGVYTCRFYKDGQWVNVTTDTRLPYCMELQPDDLYPSKGSSTPGHVLYGGSLNKNELFVPFLEKAYAKLHGSYQALAEGTGGSLSGKILEAFLDCTGGSAHRVDLHDDRLKQGVLGDESSATSLQLWKKMLRYKRKKCILTAQLRQMSFNAFDMTTTGIIKNRQYIVQQIKEVGLPVGQQSSGGASADAGAAPTLRFVKLKNVWGRGMWKGDWSNDDSKWEEHMQVENTLRSDPACEFSRSGHDGCFWMIWEDFIDTFNELFVVHVPSNEDSESFQYCVKGDWVGHSAAGAPSKAATISIHAEEMPMQSVAGREVPIDKTKWAMLHDAEPHWYRNPQYKMTVAERTTGVLVSLVQRDFRLYGGDNYSMNFVVMKEKLGKTTAVWEFNRHHVVAEAHSYETNDTRTAFTATPATPGPGGASSTPATTKAVPTREIIKEDLVLEPDATYFVIPYTDNAKVEMEFFLRVFALKPVRLEKLPPLYTCVAQGKWRNDEEESGEPSNAGGPLCEQLGRGGDENTAWCQNSQYWLRFPSLTRKQHTAVMMAPKAMVSLKVIVRKTSHKASTTLKNRAQRENASKEKFNLVGLTAVRAQNSAAQQSETSGAKSTGGSSASTHATVLRAHAKAPKTDFLGQVIDKPRAKAKDSKGYEAEHEDDTDGELDMSIIADAKRYAALFPQPRLVIHPEEWCRVSDYSSPALACMYLRKVPKEWLLADGNGGGGLMLVPTLGEANIEGTFDLQVDSDFPLVLDELPKFTTQSLPGEWTETTAAGCHLHAEWKKNPKMYLRLKGVRPAKVKITLTRSEREWKGKCKRDTVGTMMGFYLFYGSKFIREGAAGAGNSTAGYTIMVNGRPWNETDFVPLHSVQSPPELVLPASVTDPFVIMPATYEPNAQGKFVVSVQCDTEFTLSLDE